MLEKHVHLTKYLLVAPLAVCFADQNVLERLREFHIVKNAVLNKLLKFILSTGALYVLCKMFNTQWGIDHFEFALNGVIPVLIVYWSYEFVIGIPGIRQILQFIGKHSANNFLYPYIYKSSMAERSYLFSWTCGSDMAVYPGCESRTFYFTWRCAENHTI